MGNGINRRKPEPLDPEVDQYLRELAGWPLQQAHRGGHKRRHRSLTVQRDEFGRVIGSVEHIDEDEYEEYSDTWGK
jgi:hypothetical protein